MKKRALVNSRRRDLHTAKTRTECPVPAASRPETEYGQARGLHEGAVLPGVNVQLVTWQRETCPAGLNAAIGQ
jgi:hypothetical protein